MSSHIKLIEQDIIDIVVENLYVVCDREHDIEVTDQPKLERIVRDMIHPPDVSVVAREA